MGYVRFFRRIDIAPGTTLNLARRGPSVTVGMRGAHLTVGRGGIRKTVGLPGSGAYYTSYNGWHSGVHTAPQFQSPATNAHGRDGHALRVIVEAVGIAIVACLGILLAIAGSGGKRR